MSASGTLTIPNLHGQVPPDVERAIRTLYQATNTQSQTIASLQTPTISPTGSQPAASSTSPGNFGSGSSSGSFLSPLGGLGTALPTTNLVEFAANGMWSVTYYASTQTVGTGGTATITIGWTDPSGQVKTFTSGSFNLTTLGNNQSGQIVIATLAPAPITIKTTFTAATGSPFYCLYAQASLVLGLGAQNI